jgi:hypothetical protein
VIGVGCRTRSVGFSQLFTSCNDGALLFVSLCTQRLFITIVEEKAGDHFFEKGYLYDPNALDDPSMLHGAHRYVLQRKAATGPVISSIIHFVNKSELKESLNEQFRERHPTLPPSLTISKIRNLKKETLLTCMSIGFELSTVAIAMISFERLCLKSLVTKYNRRLTMAVSLLLAVKFNETMHPNYHTMLSTLFSFFDREWDLPRKQIFEAEFGAYVHLGFTMQLPFHHVYLMYSRLLKLLNESSKHYLGQTMHDIYVQEVVAQERTREAARTAARERERETREQLQQQQSAQARHRANSTDSANSETIRRPRKASRSGTSGGPPTGPTPTAGSVPVNLPKLTTGEENATGLASTGPLDAENSHGEESLENHGEATTAVIGGATPQSGEESGSQKHRKGSKLMAKFSFLGAAQT